MSKITVLDGFAVQLAMVCHRVTVVTLVAVFDEIALSRRPKREALHGEHEHRGSDDEEEHLEV